MFLGSSIDPALSSSSEGPVTSPCSSFQKVQVETNTRTLILANSTWSLSGIISECECLHEIGKKRPIKKRDNPSKHIGPQWHAKSSANAICHVQNIPSANMNRITSVSHGEAFRAAAYVTCPELISSATLPSCKLYSEVKPVGKRVQSRSSCFCNNLNK